MKLVPPAHALADHAKELRSEKEVRSLSEYRQAKNAAQTGMEIQKLFGMEVK